MMFKQNENGQLFGHLKLNDRMYYVLHVANDATSGPCSWMRRAPLNSPKKPRRLGASSVRVSQRSPSGGLQVLGKPPTSPRARESSQDKKGRKFSYRGAFGVLLNWDSTCRTPFKCANRGPKRSTNSLSMNSPSIKESPFISISSVRLCRNWICT